MLMLEAMWMSMVHAPADWKGQGSAILLPFAVLFMTTDSQLREKIIEGCYDNSPSPPPHRMVLWKPHFWALGKVIVGS